jgi:hypothetical protein
MSDFHYLMTSVAGISHYMREDTTAILDHNQALANHNDGYTPSKDMRRVASIPFVLLYQWAQAEGWPDPMQPPPDAFLRKLNSSDWSKLRTAPGTIGMSNGVIR